MAGLSFLPSSPRPLLRFRCLMDSTLHAKRKSESGGQDEYFIRDTYTRLSQGEQKTEKGTARKKSHPFSVCCFLLSLTP